MRKIIRGRLLAGMLAAVMICMSVPETAYAVEGTEGTEQPVQEQVETGDDKVSEDGEDLEGDRTPGDGGDLSGNHMPSDEDAVEGEPIPGDENASDGDMVSGEQETEQPEDVEAEEVAGDEEELPEEMTAPIIQSEKASRAGGFVQRTTNPGNNSNYTSGNPYVGPNNCTYYAWGRARELLGYRPYTWQGNAGNWWNNNDGYERGGTPRLGAIMCWGVSKDNAYGHVAVVEAIHGDGRISFSEARYNDCAFSYQTWNTSDLSKIYRGTFQGYIYLPGVGEEEQPTVPQDHGMYHEIGLYPLIPDGVYHIVSALGDRWWMTIGGLSTDDGGNVQLWGYDDMECDHHLYRFKFIDDGKGTGRGFYTIQNVKSGLYLESDGANEWLYYQDRSDKKRTNVQQGKRKQGYKGSGQEWAVNEIDRGDEGLFYTFMARCSGYYMDVEDGTAADGTNISMWNEKDTANNKALQWRLIPWAPSIGQSIRDGEYQIAPLPAGDKVVSIAGSDPQDGANVELNSYKGDYRHTFDVKYEGKGYYSIINKYSGLSMDVSGGSGTRKLGANIQLGERDIDSGAQKWMIKPCENNNGYYQVISACNGLYLDLQAGGTKDGNNIGLWRGAYANASVNLQWKFIPYEKPKLDSPTASVPSGSEVEAGAEIWLDGGLADSVYWTNDGTDPRTSSTRTLGCKVAVADNNGKPLVIKAYAVKEGYRDSDVAEFIYTVKEYTGPEKRKLTLPTASIPTNTEVEKGTAVSLSCGVNDASIYYTIDGTEPGEGSSRYTGPIVIEKDTVIKAVAVKSGYQNSDTAVFTYSVKTAETPEIPDEPETPDVPDRGEVLEEDVPQGKVENIPQGLWMSEIAPQTYTGKVIKPEVRVYDYKTRLIEKRDYTISYKNNVKANASSGKNLPTITVSGKGNYTGKETQIFEILPKQLMDDDITADSLTVSYTGKVQEPVPVVTWNGRKLAKNRDYKATYPHAQQEGNYTILLEGVGNYGGERPVTLTITQCRPVSVMKVDKVANQIYTGEEVRPTLRVKDGRNVLTEGVDYEVSYQNNVQTGTASAMIAGKGKYAGTRRVSFKIVQKASLNQAKAELTFKEPVVYTGGELKPDGYKLTVSVKNAGGNKEVVTLAEGTDFTVSYKNNIKPGTATILFQGINGCTGTLKKTYKISACNIGESAGSGGRIRIELEDSYTYAKGGCKPEPVVTFQGKQMKKGTDYTLSYRNNTALNDGSNPGKLPVVIIRGKGCFTGVREAAYKITARDIGGLSMSASDKVWQNKKNIYRTKVVIRDVDGKALSAGRDYEKLLRYEYGAAVTLPNGTVRMAGEEVSGNDILPVGTLLRVTATAKGDNYTGAVSCDYRITKADIGKAKVTIPAQTYTGKEIRPDGEIQVKLNGQVLSGDNYEITGYTNNTNKGTATVTIKGRNDCGGVKTVKFRIRGKGFLWWWR